GLEACEGARASLELASEIETLTSFIDFGRGRRLNVGLIKGGTRSNVVAAEAWAEVDVRVKTMEEAKLFDEKMHSLRAQDPRCIVAVSGGINRPPMERTE